MQKQERIGPAIYLLGLLGLAILTALLVQSGIGDVARAIATAKWGVVAVSFFHLVPLSLDSLSWWLLFPAPRRLTLRTVFWMRWVGESVSNLVPASSVGGDIL